MFVECPVHDAKFGGIPQPIIKTMPASLHFLRTEHNCGRISLDIYSGTQFKQGQKEVYQRLLETIECSSRTFLHKPCSVSIYLLLTDEMKINTGQNEPRAINSGYSMGTDEQMIVIYRHEEWQKVFLHEMIHALNLDGRMYNSVPNAALLDLGLSPTYQKIQMYEAFTELWAVMLLLNTFFEPELESCYLLELEWAAGQANKFFRNGGYENALDYFSSVKRKRIVQSTPAFEYYVAKFFMLFHEKVFHAACEDIVTGRVKIWTVLEPLMMDMDSSAHHFLYSHGNFALSPEHEERMALTWHGQLLSNDASDSLQAVHTAVAAT